MGEEKWRTAKWKGTLIHTMSNRWLNNIRKYFREGDGREKIQPIMNEIKRRKSVRKKRGCPADNAAKNRA